MSKGSGAMHEDWELDLYEAAGVDINSDEAHNALLDAERAAALIHALRQIRDHSGKSQRQIADVMGTTQSRVSNFERLGSDPRLSTVFRYSRAVGANLRFLCALPTVSVTVAEGSFSSTKNGVSPRYSQWTDHIKVSEANAG